MILIKRFGNSKPHLTYSFIHLFHLIYFCALLMGYPVPFQTEINYGLLVPQGMYTRSQIWSLKELSHNSVNSTEHLL